MIARLERRFPVLRHLRYDGRVPQAPSDRLCPMSGRPPASMRLVRDWGVWCEVCGAPTEVLAVVCEERDEARDSARQWMAHADDLAAQIERHTAACPWAAADPEQARMS